MKYPTDTSSKLTELLLDGTKFYGSFISALDILVYCLKDDEVGNAIWHNPACEDFVKALKQHLTKAYTRFPVFHPVLRAILVKFCTKDWPHCITPLELQEWGVNVTSPEIIPKYVHRVKMEPVKATNDVVVIE